MHSEFPRAFMLAVGILGVWMTTPMTAQEFRIETEVYWGNDDQPASENLTLFTEGAVYDFLIPAGSSNATEIVIYDFQRQQFILMDVEREIKVSVDQSQLVEYVTRMKTKEELIRKAPFLFEPKFDQSFDEKEEWLTLRGERMTYRVKGKSPKQQAALAIYRQFADWSCQLNSIKPGSLPPFSRLELNQALEQQGWIPEQVEMTLSPTKGWIDRKIQATTRHYMIWQLSKTDSLRIEQARENWIQFKKVRLQEYHQVQGAH